MKYFKSYTQYKLDEAYRDLSNNDFKDEYDRKFAEYALNERPFNLDSEEIEECREIYGNREVGIVYHGGKINSLDELDYLESLKIGDTITMRLKSASPHYSEAESFAYYVKSYDEYTMASQMKETMLKGSAGEYGGFIVSLKPLPEQVVIANFGKGEKPSQSAETECILNGDIKIVDIKIFQPLKKETYLSKITNFEPKQSFNSFIVQWMSYHKLPRPDLNIILDKIKTENEAYEFLSRYQDKQRDFIFEHLSIEKLKNNSIFNKILNRVVLKDGIFVLEIPNKKDFNVVYYIKGMKEYIYKKRKSEYINFYNSIKDLPFKIDYIDGYLYVDDNAAKILSVLSNLNDSKIARESKCLNQLNTIIEKFFKENIIGKKLNELSINDLENIEKFFNRIQNFHFLGLVNSDIISKGCVWFYNDMARGADLSDTKKFSIYKDTMKYVISLLGKLN